MITPAAPPGYLRDDSDAEVLDFEGAPPMFSLRDPDGNKLFVVELMKQAA